MCQDDAGVGVEEVNGDLAGDFGWIGFGGGGGSGGFGFGGFGRGIGWLRVNCHCGDGGVDDVWVEGIVEGDGVSVGCRRITAFEVFRGGRVAKLGVRDGGFGGGGGAARDEVEACGRSQYVGRTEGREGEGTHSAGSSRWPTL